MDLSKIQWTDAAKYADSHFEEDSKQNLTHEEIALFRKPLTLDERMRLHGLLQSIQFDERSRNLLDKHGRTAEQIMKELKPLINPKRKLLTGRSLRHIQRSLKHKAKRVRVVPHKPGRVKIERQESE